MHGHRILVTGAAGFLGSHLCERLLDDGFDVVGLDNYFTGSRANLHHLMDRKHFEAVRHDVTEPYRGEFDRIYHLACPASPVFYQKNPISTTKTSVFGTYHMLGLAKRLNARIMQASTSEVYGEAVVHPQPESYYGHVNPIGIRACYDEGKRVAETLCFDYWREHKVDVKVARIFNTYGPRMNESDGRVVSNFIVQALKGEPITIYGNGMQTRSFCYVDDLIDGFIKLMAMPKGYTGPVNLGNPSEITILGLAEKILDIVGGSSRLEYKPLPQDDPLQRRPDITVARADLAWSPKVELDDGLRRTIAYFEQLMSRGRISSSTPA